VPRARARRRQHARHVARAGSSDSDEPPRQPGPGRFVDPPLRSASYSALSLGGPR
jgi:hypothetical protein